MHREVLKRPCHFAEVLGDIPSDHGFPRKYCLGLLPNRPGPINLDRPARAGAEKIHIVKVLCEIITNGRVDELDVVADDRDETTFKVRSASSKSFGPNWILYFRERMGCNTY